MKLKKDRDEILVLKRNGSNLPRYKLQLVLKLAGLPPFKKKEKVIVPN